MIMANTSGKLSALPPDDADEDRLRRVLGQSAPSAEPAVKTDQPLTNSKPGSSVSLPPPAGEMTIWPPQQEQVVTVREPPKVTVSVRISPHLQKCLTIIGGSIGWSPNKIMSVLMERGARELVDAFDQEGGVGAIKGLM